MDTLTKVLVSFAVILVIVGIFLSISAYTDIFERQKWVGPVMASVGALIGAGAGYYAYRLSKASALLKAGQTLQSSHGGSPMSHSTAPGAATSHDNSRDTLTSQQVPFSSSSSSSSSSSPPPPPSPNNGSSDGYDPGFSQGFGDGL